MHTLLRRRHSVCTYTQSLVEGNSSGCDPKLRFTAGFWVVLWTGTAPLLTRYVATAPSYNGCFSLGPLIPKR